MYILRKLEDWKILDTDFDNSFPDRNKRTPFDGQGAYFHLNMSNYPDSPSSVTVTKPLETTV